LSDAIKVLKENSAYEIFEVIPLETLEEKYSGDIAGTLFVEFLREPSHKLESRKKPCLNCGKVKNHNNSFCSAECCKENKQKKK